MLKSNNANIAIGENVMADDYKFRGATALAAVRRVLDSKGFYSSCNMKDYVVEVPQSFGTCPFTIIADKAEGRLLLEAEIIDIKKIIIDEIVDIVNQMNNELLYGFCMVIDSSVIYQMHERFAEDKDDFESYEMASEFFEHFISDYITIMQGGYCDISYLIEKDILSNF